MNNEQSDCGARHYNWIENGHRQPMIRIDNGPFFVMIPYHHARRLVDEVHDLCDEHERRQREGRLP